MPNPQAYVVTERDFTGRAARIYAECTCGWQSRETDDRDDAMAAMDEHAETHGGGCPCSPCKYPSPNVACDFQTWEDQDG